MRKAFKIEILNATNPRGSSMCNDIDALSEGCDCTCVAVKSLNDVPMALRGRE